AVYMVASVPDGLGGFAQVSIDHNKFSLGSFGFGFSEATFWVVLIYSFVINLQNFGVDQNYVQRYIASKSDREARKSVWLGGLLYIPVSALFFFIGTALFAYYYNFPESLPDSYLDPGSADKVFPYFIVTELPSGITGLLIAAVFAAAMSTVSTSLNSSATIMLNDYYQRFFNRNANERESMKVLHYATVCWGALGTIIAIAMIRVQSALDAWWILAGIFSGGMLGLFLLGVISRAARNAHAIIAAVAGVSLILWFSLPKLIASHESSIHSYLIPVIGTFAILFVGISASLLFGKKGKVELH
ncbi:MAG: sodium:solute symporter, partial [Verrucomicrobiota bacterium]